MCATTATGLPKQLGRERGDVPRAARRLRRRREAVRDAVRPAALRRRPSRRARRPRRRARRARGSSASVAPSTGCSGSAACVDEDDPHATSSRMRCAYSSGVCSHGPRPLARPRASRSASARSESTRTSASASAAGSPGSTSTPETPSVDEVRNRAGARADRRRARGRTPRRARGPCPPSATAARAPTRRRARRATSAGVELLVPADAVLAHERLGDVGARSLADDAQRRRRDARRGEPPGRGEAVDVLVRLEHADEERDRLARAAARGGADERLEIHVRGKVGGRLDAELAHELRRERRDRAHRVGAAQRARRDASPSPASSRRAGEP